MDDDKIDKFEEDFIESINKEEFKDIESSKDILNFEEVNEILEDLNEVKIFFENPNLKINKTIRNKLQFITHQKELIKEDENLIKDVKLFQKIYEENAEETNKEIDIIKNNFIELSKSIEKIINLIEKVKFEFYSSVKQMMNPIIIEIENINKINKNKLNKKVLKIFEEKKKKLSKNIEEYDKKLSIIIKEIKNVFSKVKSNIEIYIDSLNNLDTPINLMNENIEKILENFEEKGKSFIDIIYNYNSTKERKNALDILKNIQNLNSEIIKSIEECETFLKTQNNNLEQRKKESSDDFDEIIKLNDKSSKKLHELEIETKNIIKEINELLKLCSLKQIKSDIKEYNGIPIDKIKKGVIEGTDIIIQTNKKLEVDITRLKKFVQEKEKEKNDAISLDLAFIMDATGSMEEYLEFAKKQIISVIDSITKDSSAMVKLGFVGYKDYLEGEHKYIIFPKLTNKIEEVKNFIKSAKVEGGGDECEDMVGGLNSALNYDWESSSRFAMLIADAPCHGVQYHGMPDLDSHPDGDPKYKIDEIVQKFAEKNINLLCLNLKPTTKQLYDNFKKYFEKGKKSTSNCDIIVEDFNKEPIKLANIIVSKAKIFYEKRHDIIKGD